MRRIFVWRGSLLLKLIGAFLLVIVIGALTIYFLTTRATQNAFRLYTTQNSQLWAQRLAPELAGFYAQTGSWRGVDAFLQSNTMETGGMMNGMGAGRGRGGQGIGWMGGMGQRLIVADGQGKVIADTADASGNSDPPLTGSQLTPAELASGAAVIVNGQVVGTLIVTPANLKSVSNPADTFLASVNRSLLISVLAAGSIGLILVLLFSLQITSPIRQMQKAAGAIARGDLDQRVPVRSKDELGDLAESFNQMAGSLAKAKAQRQQLLADVAHELRTPLAVIQANTEGIQDGVLPLDLEQISAIHTETLLLGRLIDDLRLLSLAEAGELRLERQPVEPGRLLEAVAERFQPQCAQKGVALSLTIDQGLTPVTVDVDRINQVLNNLVSNALRYTPEGGRISLEARRLSDEIQISVSDTGPGIPADDLPWVFDRFYRAEKSRARNSGGTGLGLAIVRQLVEAHGGRVRAESPVPGSDGPARGARISFTLPVAAPGMG